VTGLDPFTSPTPEWYRVLVAALALHGAVVSLLFVACFLWTRPLRSGRARLSGEVVDQWLLFACAGFACCLYAYRWLSVPPPTWGGPWHSAALLALMVALNVAVVVRVSVWRSRVGEARRGDLTSY